MARRRGLDQRVQSGHTPRHCRRRAGGATPDPVARALRYDVVIGDSRSAFATQDRFGDIEIAREWPDEALPKIGVDGRTELIALTHAPKIDDPALIYALTSDAFYVGALESKKTHAKRRRG